MNKKIFYISDFFVEQVLGGGELNDDELIKMLKQNNFEVVKAQSHTVTAASLQENADSFFIISNFCNLSRECKAWISKNAHYIIYEHDHKYTNSRNPAIYKNFQVPSSEVRNYSFYNNALRIIAQSSFHKDIIEKNLEINNVVSVGGNLWSVEVLSFLRSQIKNNKKETCAILQSNISHKNTYGAIQYCKHNNLQYELVSSPNYYAFLKRLSKNKSFIFLPKTPETLSRVAVEARMMGMSVKTNSLVGATSEPWFEMKGEKLIDYMLEKRKEIFNIIVDLTSQKRNISDKKISIISTFHEGEEFLDGFLENMVNQTIFDKCEMIIIDAASPGKERNIVEKYLEKHDNIKYYRIEEKLGPTPCFNMAIRKSECDLITFGFIDDRKSKSCLETLYNELEKTKVDLVYGDVAQTMNKNEKFEDSSSKVLFEHSTYPFKRENMVKCLPGPMPLWKREIHEECGFFDEDNCDFADDWDMWLRAVDNGFIFKKIDQIVGLYLVGGRSQQQGNLKQLKEEAKIFFKYKHIFGKNFNIYKPYFEQFL